ncbi:MAG: MltA domain-containing protein [Deltaproteobacteria bacterium]|nr:MltA domain-containing protein [Deltaproteobacteria bacterium]
MFKCFRPLLVLLAVFSIVACVALPRKPPPVNYQKSTVGNLDFFADEDASLLEAIKQSRSFYQINPNFRFSVEGNTYNAAEMIAGLDIFERIVTSNATKDEKRRHLLQNFDILSIGTTARDKSVVFTGYYETTVNGSLHRDEIYQYPIYHPPPELGSDAQKNHSRYEIDVAGKLKGRGLEIAWVDDPGALYFLHLQGSGIILLAEGKTIPVTFAGTNGRPFRSVANHFFAQGLISNRSNAAVKKYLRENPQLAQEKLSYNERYTFFRLGKTTGAIGMPLTAERSIAVDFAFFPRGGLAFIETAVPDVDVAGNYIGKRKIAKFVLCQDTGGAIKGPQRVDLFFGNQAEAGSRAHFMKDNGAIHILLKKK